MVSFENFAEWWSLVGAEIPRFSYEDEEAFVERMAKAAWNAAVASEGKIVDPRDAGRG